MTLTLIKYFQSNCITSITSITSANLNAIVLKSYCKCKYEMRTGSREPHRRIRDKVVNASNESFTFLATVRAGQDGKR